MGAPRVEIDLTELEKLCQLGCTEEEIAAWFNVSTRTIERRRQEPEFAEVIQRGRARGRISVRRMQMKLLEQGNASMGIWLGRQLLGQTERPDERVTLSLEEYDAKQLARVISNLSTAKLKEVLRECGMPVADYAVIDVLALPASSDEGQSALRDLGIDIQTDGRLSGIKTMRK
jgi:hypothetical protein